MIATQDIVRFLDSEKLCLMDFLPIDGYEIEEEYLERGAPSDLKQEVVGRLQRWKSNEEMAEIVQEATGNYLDCEILDKLKEMITHAAVS